MIYFKSCLKCHGDMYLNRDRYGAYLECLQCGLVHDLVEGSPHMSQVKKLLSRPEQVVIQA